MNITVLGCSGGISSGLRTTAMLVDDDILIDAGTGVGDLSMEQLVRIDHIFVTHSHLDHITSIPFLLDTVMGYRVLPVTLHALAETIEVLKTHIFNWKIWPDFNAIPDEQQPLLQYREISLGETTTIKDRHITALPANHVVPAVGYRLDSGRNSLVFSGDTTSCEVFWDEVNKIENLKYLIIETAFGDDEIELARVSKHLCPVMLLSELARLERQAEVFITHLKPGEDEAIMHEIAGSAAKPSFIPQQLQIGTIFKL
jgi:ribonuclease BN (tRNA processing enzyme)